MTRPVVLIGLGGVGQWVLTFVKKNLLESGNGTLPANVKLLAFDTTSLATAIGGYSGASDHEAIRVGSVELVEGAEFISIGGNVVKLATEIAGGRHSHLQWFPAKSFLNKLPPAGFNTKEGSGQIRQMGRISLFNDIRAERRSLVLASLRSAIQKLQSQVERDTQLEIIVVSSLAGGTGAGMLIDMAWLAQSMATQSVQQNYFLRGFFFLPRVFASSGIGESRDMLARCYATWRELDRFMILSEGFGPPEINYHEDNPDLQVQTSRRVYDVSYIVDSERRFNSLSDTRPEEGVYPLVANFITSILDSKAGRAYSEFVSSNLAGKLARLPRFPYHSAIGSYTLKVPVFYACNRFMHELVVETLNRFLVPEFDNSGRVIRLSEMQSSEVEEGRDVHGAALSFMRAGELDVAGNKILNTKFLSLVAEIREAGAISRPELISEAAQGGLTRVGSRYLDALAELGQDVLSRRIIDDIFSFSVPGSPIWQKVLLSKEFGDTPDQTFARIVETVRAFRHEYYGLDTAAGERLRGRFGVTLDRAKDAQTSRFFRFLQVWMLNTLNGEHMDSLVARGGKLGYVHAFCGELISALSDFLQFLSDIRRERNETLKLALRAQEAARAAYHDYERNRGRKSIIHFWDNFVHPAAHRARQRYLLAEQLSIDVRSDDILLDMLAETAAEMLGVTEETRDEVASWVAHLATGDPETRIAGLYAVAVESLHSISVNHELDKRLSKVLKIIGEHEYLPDTWHIAEMLRSLRWQVDVTRRGLQLTCGVEIPSEDLDEPHYTYFQRSVENSVQYNLELLLKLAERQYRSVVRDYPIAREVMKEWKDGSALAAAVDRLAEPSYMPDATSQGPELGACYIAVHSDIDEKTTVFFREFEGRMKGHNSTIKGYSGILVDSDDPHKLTLMRSDDLLPSTDFEMWHSCREAYIQQVTDSYRPVPAAELHIFPAEINACYYEAEIPVVLQKDYDLLHPVVVALLEDRERIELFFWCLALGYIDQAGGVYRLNAPDMPEIYLTSPLSGRLEHHEPDLLQTINNFVNKGSDQRPRLSQERLVDWSLLRTSVLKQSKLLGKSRTKQLILEQLEGTNGIVKTVKDNTLKYPNAEVWEDLADLAIVILNRALSFTESLGEIEITQVQQFLEEAGFDAIRMEDRKWFLCHPNHHVWKARFKAPVPIHLFLDEPLNHTSVIDIYEKAKAISQSKGTEFIFIVVNTVLADSAWLQIATLRAEGVQIIPIDDSVIQAGSASQRERQELEKHLIRFIGKNQDLYGIRHPVADRLSFFGREAFAGKLLKQLGAGQPIGLFGIRKIGKTSILYYLRNRASFPTAYVDLEKGCDLPDLYRHILRSWEASIRVMYPDLHWTAPSMGDKRNPSALFVETTSELSKTLASFSLASRLGLLVDEVELIAPGGDAASRTRYLTFARTIRGLVQEDRNLSILVAGVSPRLNFISRWGEEQNPFYQFFDLHYLGQLTHQDTVQMIRNIGQQTGLVYTDATLDYVAEISGCHPFFARQLCSLAIRSSGSLNTLSEVSLDELRKAALLFVRNPDTASHLDERGLWGEITNQKTWPAAEATGNQLILEDLADAQPRSEGDLLREGHDLRARESALFNLYQRAILTKLKNLFSIRYPLFRSWIRRYHLRIEE